MMAEDRGRGGERLEQLNLRRGVDDMVLAANDVGDAEIDVVDDARQRIEIGAVRSHQHGVRQRSGIHMLPPALELKLFPRLVSGIEPATCLQLLDGGLITRKAV